MAKELRLAIGEFLVIGELLMVLEAIDGNRPKFLLLRSDGREPWKCHDLGAILATQPDLAEVLADHCPQAKRGVLLTSRRQSA